jgi:hypothetical protein
MSFTPFSDGDTFGTFRALLANLTQEIRALENGYVLRTSATELEQHFVEKVLIEPLKLHVDDYHIEDQRSVQVDARRDPNRFFMSRDGRPYHIPGTQLTIAIPFEGDPMLWKIRASTYSVSGYPEIDVRGSVILLRHQFADDSADPNRLKQEIDHQVESLKKAVEYLFLDVEQHNRTAPETIKSELARKREQALAASGAVSAIGIPIKRKDQPATYVAPVTRRRLPIQRPTPSPDAFKPEPELSETEYQHILTVIKSLCLVIERNPSSFATLDEESIRDHILLQLNGHYEGAATGETFNSNGKTDILIRVDNRNIFVAEC